MPYHVSRILNIGKRTTRLSVHRSLHSIFQLPDTRDERGQGLLELVMALGILVAGLTVVLNVAIANTVFNRESSQRAVAASLAREGIEAVEHIRFSNIDLGVLRTSWDQDLAAGSYVAVFDPVAAAPLSWALQSITDINDSKAEFKFQSSAADPLFSLRLQGDVTSGTPITTGFRRLIQITDLCTPGASSCAGLGNVNKIGLRVTSQVQWLAGGRRTTTVEEMMYHWQP